MTLDTHFTTHEEVNWMSLIVRNLQNVVRFNEQLLHKHVKLLRHIAGFQDYDLGIILVSDNEMIQINESYRGYSETTDVLAFPFHEIPVENAGQIPNVCEEEMMLGDIVLGMPYIREQAILNGTDMMTDMMTHITHGLCHLVGYDHHTHSAWSAMYNRELHILERFNEKTGSTCVPLLKVGHFESLDDT